MYYTEEEAAERLATYDGRVEMRHHKYVDATPYGGVPCWLKYADEWEQSHCGYKEFLSRFSFRDNIATPSFKDALPTDERYFLTMPDGFPYPCRLEHVGDWVTMDGTFRLYHAEAVLGSTHKNVPVVIDSEGRTFINMDDRRRPVGPARMEGWTYLRHEDGEAQAEWSDAAKNPLSGWPVKFDDDFAPAFPGICIDTGLQDKIDLSVEVSRMPVLEAAKAKAKGAPTLDGEVQDAKAAVKGKDAPPVKDAQTR
jgi:hypothetical protein